MGSTVKKIALLSGGGDCPGLNAVIRTITKTAISKYGYEVVLFMAIEVYIIIIMWNLLKNQ